MNRHSPGRLFVFVGWILLTMAACRPVGPVPAATDPDFVSPSATFAPPSSPGLTSTPTASPTPLPTAPPTPTADPGWFDANHFFSESDYYYYHNLLLNVGDSSPLVEVTQASGWGQGIKSCPTCDAVAIRYAAATCPPTDTEVEFIVALYRHRSVEAAQAALQEFQAKNIARGASLVEIPAGAQLPPGAVILQNRDSGMVAVVTPYGSFETWVLQQAPANLTEDRLVAVFASLAEMQIQKLRQAGY